MLLSIGPAVTLASAIAGGFLIAPWEGKVNSTYLDPVNIVTACYGKTDPSFKLGSQFTDEQCMKMLAEDLPRYEAAVDKVIAVPLPIYTKAALISFTYNVGEGNLKKSTLAKKFNNMDYVGGCDELTRWVYAGKGKKLPGLVSRRTDEWNMCMGNIEVKLGDYRIN